MSKIFIDCGYYKGGAFKLFARTNEYDADFVFYAFEPGWQFCPEKIIKAEKQKIVNNKVILSDKAVWIKDGTIDFYRSGRRGGKANSLYKNLYATKEVVSPVQCIDFSKWIIDNFSKDDYIVLKLDIEGAEFEVLNKMINDGSIQYIKIAYIEFHSYKAYSRCPGWEKNNELYKNLEKKLLDIKGLEIRKKIEWYVAELALQKKPS